MESQFQNDIHPFLISHKDYLFKEFNDFLLEIHQIYTAIYVRVSTDKQYKSGTSIDSQIHDCLEKAKELGILPENVRIYVEGGQSGEDIDRPEMNRLREDVEKGFIKNLIITHPDRFSREMVGKLGVCSDLERNEVNLFFTDMEFSDTPEGKLFFNMISSIAQYELEQIKRRTRKGIKRAVKEKKKIQPMRVAPFGYDLIDGKFIKNNESPFVEKIFKWYIEGSTMREIGELLHCEGIMPKRGESDSWNQSSIQRILKNENYIGKYYYNKRKTKKVKGERTKKGKQKRTYTYRNEEDWWLIDDPNIVPPLIDLELFYKAQSQRLSNWKEKGQIKHEYLLSKLIYCDCCNIKFSPFTSQSQQKSKKTGETKKWFYKRYRCQNKNPRKYGGNIKRCSLPVLNANLLEEFIWERFIQNSICDVDMLKEKLLEKENDGQDPKRDELSRQKKKLEEVEKESERVRKSFQKGWMTEEEADKEMEVLMAQQKSLKIDVNELENQINTKTDVKLSKEQILESALKISKLLKEGYELPFEIKKKIVNLLINEIRISEGKNENEINVKVIGILDQSKIITTTEQIQYSLNEDDDKLLRHPSPQPQGVVNKSNVVLSEGRNASEALVHKGFVNHKAFIEYIAKITFLTENGKQTKMKFRKSKFAIS